MRRSSNHRFTCPPASTRPSDPGMGRCSRSRAGGDLGSPIPVTVAGSFGTIVAERRSRVPSQLQTEPACFGVHRPDRRASPPQVPVIDTNSASHVVFTAASRDSSTTLRSQSGDAIRRSGLRAGTRRTVEARRVAGTQSAREPVLRPGWTGRRSRGWTDQPFDYRAEILVAGS